MRLVMRVLAWIRSGLDHSAVVESISLSFKNIGSEMTPSPEASNLDVRAPCLLMKRQNLVVDSQISIRSMVSSKRHISLLYSFHGLGQSAAYPSRQLWNANPRRRTPSFTPTAISLISVFQWACAFFTEVVGLADCPSPSVDW